jgi:hypothetical protein
MSKVGKLLDWFHRAPARVGTHDFRDLLMEACRAALGMSRSEAERYAVGNSNRVWQGLSEHQYHRSKMGVTATMHLLEDTRKCAWSSCQPRELADRPRFWIRHKARPHMLSSIDTLSSREYEALGCVTALLCGAQHVKLTPPGDECGVDFFAVVGVHSNNHVFGGMGSLIRVVGQSKKYESKVPVDRIRGFNDTLEDIRRTERKVSDLVPAWFHANHGPIVGWMISHRGYQSGALSRAKSHGILVSDSLDIAEISALSRQIDETLRPQDRAQTLKLNTARFLEENDC